MEYFDGNPRFAADAKGLVQRGHLTRALAAHVSGIDASITRRNFRERDQFLRVGIRSRGILQGGGDSECALLHSLLNQIAHLKAQPLVAAGLGDDQAQVGVDHALLGLEVAALDPLGEFDLLGGGQQRVDPSLLEEQLERLARPAFLITTGGALDSANSAAALTRIGGPLARVGTRAPATTARP